MFVLILAGGEVTIDKLRRRKIARLEIAVGVDHHRLGTRRRVEDRIDPVTAREGIGVVAPTALKRIVVEAATQIVVAVIAFERVGEVRAAQPFDAVEAVAHRIAGDRDRRRVSQRDADRSVVGGDIETIATDQRVAPRAADQGVVAEAAEGDVVAAAAHQSVLAGVAVEQVVLLGTGHGVVTGAAGDPVLAARGSGHCGTAVVAVGAALELVSGRRDVDRAGVEEHELLNRALGRAQPFFEDDLVLEAGEFFHQRAGVFDADDQVAARTLELEVVDVDADAELEDVAAVVGDRRSGVGRDVDLEYARLDVEARLGQPVAPVVQDPAGCVDDRPVGVDRVAALSALTRNPGHHPFIGEGINQRVAAVAALELEHVVARAANHLVFAGSAGQDVVARIAADLVVAAPARNAVGAQPAGY